MSHWLYKNKTLEEAPAGYFGFVYIITNKKSGKKYIGRKYFGTTRRVKVAGKKKKKSGFFFVNFFTVGLRRFSLIK